LGSAQGHRIIRLEQQLAAKAHDAFEQKQFVIRKTLEDHDTGNCKARAAAFSTPRGTVSISRKDAAKRCIIQKYEIAELEVGLVGNEYYICAAREAC